MVSPALDGEWAALSLRASWMDPAPLELLGLNRVRSFEGLRDLLRTWSMASLNFVYADTSGAIGWQFAARAPVRSGRHGMVPAAAWDHAAQWLGEPVPFDELPFEADPDAGFLATANNQPVADDGSGPWLGADWMESYRVARIAEALGRDERWDLDACLRLQMDVTSLPWRDLRGLVLAAGQDGDAVRSSCWRRGMAR